MELQHFEPIPELRDFVGRIMYVKYRLDVTPGSLQNDLLKSPLRLQADSTRLA